MYPVEISYDLRGLRFDVADTRELAKMWTRVILPVESECVVDTFMERELATRRDGSRHSLIHGNG